MASPKSPTTPKRVPKASQKTPKSDLLQDLISKPALVSLTHYLQCFVHILSSRIRPFLDFFSFLHAPLAYKPARMPKRPCPRASGAVPTPSGHPQWPPQAPNGSQKRVKKRLQTTSVKNCASCLELLIITLPPHLGFPAVQKATFCGTSSRNLHL